MLCTCAQEFWLITNPAGRVSSPKRIKRRLARGTRFLPGRGFRGGLPVAAISLSRLYGLLRLPVAILGQRTAYVIALLDTAAHVSADIALVATRSDEFALGRWLFRRRFFVARFAIVVSLIGWPDTQSRTHAMSSRRAPLLRGDRLSVLRRRSLSRPSGYAQEKRGCPRRQVPARSAHAATQRPKRKRRANDFHSQNPSRRKNALLIARPASAPSAIATATRRTSRETSPATYTPGTLLSSVSGSITMPPFAPRLQPRRLDRSDA